MRRSSTRSMCCGSPVHHFAIINFWNSEITSKAVELLWYLGCIVVCHIDTGYVISTTFSPDGATQINRFNRRSRNNSHIMASKQKCKTYRFRENPQGRIYEQKVVKTGKFPSIFYGDSPSTKEPLCCEAATKHITIFR